MTPILLYSHTNEPITNTLLSSQLDQKCGLIKLNIETLLNHMSIIDEVCDSEVKINWIFPSGDRINNSKNHYLINRVLSVPETLFQSFSEEDRLYALSEFRAYLAFAIEAFPLVFSRPGAFGLSGSRYSLVRQWEMVSNSKLTIQVPKYYLGTMIFCPLIGDVIYSHHSFDYYYWKPNRDLVDIEKMVFAFLRPPGKPLVASVVGSDVQVFSCDPLEDLSEAIREQTRVISLSLSRLFDYSIAEILFFDDGQSISFGMISNIPYASSKKSWFPGKIASYFEEEISGKYGKH